MVGVKTLIAECRNQSKHRAADVISCVLPAEGEEEGEKNEVTVNVNSIAKIIISEEKSNTGEDRKTADAVGCDSAANTKREACKLDTSE